MRDLQMENLTERQAKILRDIVAAPGFITFSALAQAQGVSTRTIIRELDDCESLLKAAGIALERRAGLGIRLAGPDEDRARILQMLQSRTVHFVYNMPERLVFLRQILLREDEPVKLFTLNRLLKAAESTISGDLERIDPWFSACGLTLVRRPGLGIYLEGSEAARRKALKELLNEVLNEDSLIELMLQQERSDIRKRLNALLNMGRKDIDNLHLLIQTAEAWETHNRLIHLERNFLNLILTLVVLTWRPVQPAEEAALSGAAAQGALPLAASLMEEIATILGMPGLTRATLLIAAQLPLLYPELSSGEPADDSQATAGAAELARQMICLIQGETGYAIHDEGELVDALANHLRLALTRLRFGQTIHNPLEKDIKENYPKWFELAEKCADLIEQALKKPVPDAEVAYLTMYLGAAMEKAAIQSERRYHVAVLCPAGMSSSVLLASRVEAVFPQVTVDAIISFHQAAEIIHQQRFDLILTTAHIVLPGIPILTVRPFFPKEDQERLRQVLAALVPRKVPASGLEKEDLRRQLTRMNELVSGLFSLLDNFFYLDCTCRTMAEAITLTARQIRPDNPETFAEALARRESFGHVILEDQEMALLHARSAEVSDLHFGVLKPAQPLKIEGKPVATILVMAAPLDIAPVKLDIMRQISRSIIDDEHFCSLLRHGTANAIYRQLETILRTNFPVR